MKISIGHKIALLYSAITFCVAGLVFVVVFYWMSGYSDRIYYSFLEEHAYLIAQKKLDKGEAQDAGKDYLKRKRYEGEIVQATSQFILDADDKKLAHEVLKHFLTDSQIDDLYHQKQIRFKQKNNLGVALYRPKQEGNFIVVVTSGHGLGKYMYVQLGYWMSGCILLCFLLVWLVSKLYALHRINSLNEAYLREKQFVHHASHELNNPLTAIQGECEIALLRPRSIKEYEASLTMIGTEAKRMAEIIHQLLYLANAMDDLKSIESDILSLPAFLKTFSQGRVKLLVDSECTGMKIEANAFLLGIAIGNIVNNALKYSSSTVLLHLKKNVLLITDYGIGIPKEDLPYVFQPFYRAGNAQGYKGHGVGLSLVLRILEVYHIVVRIVSTDKSGTTVSLVFPKRMLRTDKK